MHQEALDNNTRAVWDKCTFLQDFYLAGGTALALQIGHRKSVDLDFFSSEPIKKTLLKTLEEKFTKVALLANTTDELTVLVDDAKVTFLHYPFTLLYPTLPTNVVPLASVKDIASMKAYALGRRQSLKDYIDLYTIFSLELMSLGNVLFDSQRKYGEAFNDRLFSEQLLYTDDLEDENIYWLTEPKTKEGMKDFFKKLLQEIG